MKTPVYLDYAATTPVDAGVAETMARYLTVDGNFANPASRAHMMGWMAEQAVESARRQVADLVNCDPREIVWTSGATEADNLAIKGVATYHQGRGRHIVTSAIEHKAVLDSCRYLEQQGFEVTYLQPDREGLIHPEQVGEALREDTILVSLMHANNEIGVITDIAAIGAITREHGALFHVDAAQSAGKLPIDLKALPVDLMSFSGHKIYGPKGIGALYVGRQPEVRLDAQIHGGGHERGMRSGTLPTHQIVGMGEAFALAAQRLEQDHRDQLALRERLWQGLSALPGVHLNGHAEQRLAGNLNVAFEGVDGEALLMALKDLAVSTGSACNSASVDPSYVLTTIGVPRPLALSSIRISLGRYTTEEDVAFALEQMTQALHRLRS